MTPWYKYSEEALRDIYSDYYKDVHGFRPNLHSLDHQGLVEHLEYLDQYMERMKSTPQGRAQLREEGWIIEEPKDQL